MDIEEAARAILLAAETQPPHAYWHGLGDERMRLARDPARAGALLAPALGHASHDVRRFVARLLRELGQADVLRRALGDADEDVRYEACLGVLGIAVGVPRAYAPPIELPPVLHDEVLAALRSFAARPYTFTDVVPLRVRLGDPALLAVPRTDPQWPEAVRALAYVRGGGARVLDLTRDHDADTRRAACIALYEHFVDLDREAAIAALVERLADPTTRSIAARALGTLDARETEPALLASELDDGVIMTLARWQSAAALPRILALAAGGNIDAIDALARYAPTHTIEDSLLAVLGSDLALDIRRHAAEVLSHAGSAASVPALQKFVAHDARDLPKRQRKEIERRLPVRIAQLAKRPR